MAARTIEGPEKDWLDMADLTHLTRLSESTIKRLIATGEFPAALEVTSGLRMWSWKDVLFWQLRVELRPRMLGGAKAAGGHRGPGASQEGSSDERDGSDA